MAKGKNFNDFTYGVGLEVNASSFKQVKDDLKVNLDVLKKMIKNYNEMLKLDPNADFSSLNSQIKQMKSLIDGISGSNNSMGDFVDKGVLDRVAGLESNLAGVKAISDETKASLSELKSIVATLVDPLKTAGQAKFPATFDNLFGDFKDQSAQIKSVMDQVKQFEALLKQLQEMRFNIYDSDGLDFSKNKGISEDELDSYGNLVDEFYTISEKLKSANPNELNSLVKEYKDIVNQMITTFGNMSTEQFNDLFLDSYLKEIDEAINGIKLKRESLGKELSLLQAEQEKYVNKQSAQSASHNKSLGVQSEYNAQVKVTPKANDTEWANKINDVIKNIEPQLNPVKLTPTFSKGKNIEKELTDSAAQINHVVKADIQVTDNIEQFNKKIQGIDQSIKNAKAQLEKEGNFKVRFEYEEGGKFKDVVYGVINKLKKIDAKFYITNGKTFIKDVKSIVNRTKSLLKEFEATVTLGNQDELMSKVDTLRTDIEQKLSNIGVNLNIKNLPQFMAQAAMMRDSVESYYDNNPVGVITGPSKVEAEPESATKSVVELSDKAKEAQAQIEKIKNTLKSLSELGFKSKDFLNLGRFDENLKPIKGSKKQMQQFLEDYEELYSRVTSSKEELLNIYGSGESGYAAYQQDLNILQQIEDILNSIVQEQIQYAQSRLEATEKILAKEMQVTEVKKEQSNVDSKDSSGQEANQQLAMSAEEATKKIRSLNGTLTQQKRVLKDLDTNGIGSKSLIRLGEWDKSSNSFKKNSSDIQQLIDRYNELRKARLAAGGAGKPVSGEEASLRSKLSAILRQQKKHINEIIVANQTELEAVKEISAAYKQGGSVKSQSAKSAINQVDELTKKLEKAKTTLSKLQSGDFSVVGSTGLGDVNGRLKNLEGPKNLKETLQLYNQLIEAKNEWLNGGGKGEFQYAQVLQIIEEKLSEIYQDQLKYTKTRITSLEAEIAKENEKLNIQDKSKQSSSQKTSTDQTSSVVKLDSSTLSSLAKDETLKSIDGKINNILSNLNNINIDGSNISINANNVAVSGKGSFGGAAGGTKKDPGESEVKLSTISSYSQQLTSLEERIKRTGLYTDDLQQKFADLHTQLNAIKVQDDADAYKFDLDRFKEDFEQLKTYDKLYQDFIKSQTKQIRLNDQIVTSSGPTAELQEQLKAEEEISRTIEAQLENCTTLYDQRARQLAIDEAIKKANQEIVQNIAKQSDSDINKQNNNVAKIVDNAQKKLAEMQYSMQSSKVPMADAAITKLKQYEQLLTSLKAKQQEIAANPDLLKDVDYKNNFDSLLQQMKAVQTEFGTLQTSSENFLSKIKNIEDIKPLGAAFDSTNLAQLHNEMREFANQAGVGAAKLVEFNDIERTATFEIQDGTGQVQQLTVAYDEATNSLGRYTTKTKESLSESQKFFNSLKHSFQNVARYIASFGSIYRLFAMVKQGVTYVKEIDSALAELKKVTDETDESYDKFLQNMSKTAGVVGSTVKDLTTMAAEWARLGYSMEEAGKLAESTAILLNVSEFEDATKASEALISTMQAFQYTADESQHVVDILNEVKVTCLLIQ